MVHRDAIPCGWNDTRDVLPFSQTNWYRFSLGYLDLRHEGLVVLMLLLAVLMVSNVKYAKFPPMGLRSARGIFGLVVHLIILLGGLFAPEYFLFPIQGSSTCHSE